MKDTNGNQKIKLVRDYFQVDIKDDFGFTGVTFGIKRRKKSHKKDWT